MTEYYLFATFVFILCLGMLIVMKFVFKLDKPDNRSQGTKEREARILKLYEQIEDMLEGFEEYAEEAKNEIKNEKEETSELIGKIGKNENSLSINEDYIEEIVNKNIENKLDNKVSEAVRRIVARYVREEMDSALEDILNRINKLESRSIGVAENSDESNDEVKEFLPTQFLKKPETLEEIGESIEKAIKNNSSNETKEIKKKKRKKAIELYKAGMDINDIAREVGITSSEIKLIIDVLD